MELFLIFLLILLLYLTFRKQCGYNQEYTTCGTACPLTCENPNPNRPCTLQCVIGCQCKPGYLKHKSGKCVKPADC
ncbi:Chymotrypsin inhibitor [Invertebrate iridescent virus 30]|uniref:Chymotrypsin inhibitor n=2 Tax=Invertebrate iridescent virus 22 TaxID=345198 RepID=W8W2H8_9VIRU|nr:immune reactive putative protease inhibitor [Invertebrate iridescent virus 22]YP_009010329.1 Chymotrypsin inhibitor [Invertebrate iridescent virus 30]YP_009010798.1 immune reactive putative protease inhibitor [Invertebrate iridescent virus 22]CCV01713.1 immune reactive putative protease inhibitor [Invertebrate iridescent virus 22]CCV01881.1 immune reactive putative protease inhibitor [Invertebrate iridescent virus 22]CCV02230.1 Chymotrypsin inhibitor [Invertebrate iridescent virus 30]